MIAITSISPVHKNDQQKAVKSWFKFFDEVHSINGANECDVLEGKYKGVTFFETNNTLEKLYERPHVAIDAIFKHIKETDGDYFCLINSDIELNLTEPQIEKIKKLLETGIVCANRWNYNKNHVNATKYDAGIDVFFFKKEYLDVYKPCSFALGQCHFDYWIPYCQFSKRPVYLVHNKIALHQDHATQYNNTMWQKTAIHFARLEKITLTNTGTFSQKIYNHIYKQMKTVYL